MQQLFQVRLISARTLPRRTPSAAPPTQPAPSPDQNRKPITRTEGVDVGKNRTGVPAVRLGRYLGTESLLDRYGAFTPLKGHYVVLENASSEF